MDQEQEDLVRKQEGDQADDVATLYSWANLHGAKYRDFSASRQEVRAQMRQRAVAEQARMVREEGQKENASSGEHAIWSDMLPAPPRPRPPSGSHLELADAFEAAAEARRNSSGSIPAYDGTGNDAASRSGVYPVAKSGVYPAQRPSGAHTAPKSSGSYALPVRDQEYPLNGGQAEAEAAQAVRPAWLAERSAAAQAPGSETLQQSRERVASRWFALQGIFGKGREEPQRVEGGESRIPVVTVYSLAGGVGKTSLVATVGRALASRGERVLLADACSFGLLPFYFGAREVKPGVVRTFSGTPTDPPIRIVSLDLERDGQDPDLLRRELARSLQDATRVLVDVGTGSTALLRQALRLSPTVLVPIVPDMASVVTLQSLEAFFRSQDGGKTAQVWYVLNQFDASLPLHLDLREVLRQQLGERLLPFAIHRSTAVSEALAEGMTVLDYAPSCPAAEDMMNLVNWIRSSSAAVAGAHRGVRWSER
jgi:cellulose biosynthesis protein BcsQ